MIDPQCALKLFAQTYCKTSLLLACLSLCSIITVVTAQVLRLFSDSLEDISAGFANDSNDAHWQAKFLDASRNKQQCGVWAAAWLAGQLETDSFALYQ